MDKKYLLIILGFFLVLLDQVTKFFMKNVKLDLRFFQFNFVTNTGISFGLFKGSSLVIIIISCAVLVALYYFREEFKGKNIYLTLIVSGIFGNLIDRLFLGSVRDFIDFRWWPIFNVADSLLFIVVFGIIITSIIELFKEKKVTSKTGSKKKLNKAKK